MTEDVSVPVGMDRRDVTTFAEAGRLVEDLEQVFKALGIAIPPGSDFADVWMHTVEMENKRLGKTPIDLKEDIRPAHRKVLGLLDLAPRILRAHARGDTKTLRGHLELMTKCAFSQNVRAITEEGSNKVFELLMGLVCSEAGKDLAMDSPTNPKGDNPDVLVTMDQRRWALACKVMNGYSALTLFERIEEGIRQIRDSEAEVGCVVVNLKNVIDHDKFWPILRYEDEEPVFGSWPNYQPAANELLALAGERHFRLQDDNSKKRVHDLFQREKTIQGVLLFLQTSITYNVEGKQVPTSLGVLNLMRFGSVSDRNMAVLQNLNNVLHHR